MNASVTLDQAITKHGVPYHDYGFKTSSFGGVVTRTAEISVWIVITSGVEPCGVYIFHGVPAGEFWRNDAPLVRCKTLDEAREKAATIFGITGSGDLASIVDARR